MHQIRRTDCQPCGNGTFRSEPCTDLYDATCTSCAEACLGGDTFALSPCTAETDLDCHRECYCASLIEKHIHGAGYVMVSWGLAFSTGRDSGYGTLLNQATWFKTLCLCRSCSSVPALELIDKFCLSNTTCSLLQKCPALVLENLGILKKLNRTTA